MIFDYIKILIGLRNRKKKYIGFFINLVRKIKSNRS